MIKQRLIRQFGHPRGPFAADRRDIVDLDSLEPNVAIAGRDELFGDLFPGRQTAHGCGDICVSAYMSTVSDDVRFRAMANPTRRALLRLVRDEPQPVGALAAELRASQPAVSQHLAVLRDAGLVRVTVDGRRRLYRADLESLVELREFFDEYWSASVDRLAVAAERRRIGRGSAS